MQKEKIRLDDLLVKRGICVDQKRAQSLIFSGSVLVEEQKVTKAGISVSPNVQIRLIEKISKNVGRGKIKLDHAIDEFKVEVDGLVCLDFGASTGGFTQALLERGAKKVYSFDVGYGLIAGKLRNDKRVIVKDRFNVKNISADDFETEGEKILIAIDVSFISLLSIFPAIVKLKQNSPKTIYEIISLIKPQFECSADCLEKGIVKKLGTHFKVLRKICNSVKYSFKGKVLGVCESPILGAKGNKEFFVHWILEK